MKKWLYLLFVLMTVNSYGSGPPLFRFYIKNTTGENVLLFYKLSKDFSEGISIEFRDEYSTIRKILENNEMVQVNVSYDVQYEKRYTGEMHFEKGYISIEDFMLIFGDFSFTLLESNKVLYKEDMRQEYIKYTMDNPGKRRHFFVLEIPQEK
jgi:hypothetical protein